MRAALLFVWIAGCGSEDVGKRADPAVVDPADFTLTLAQAQAAIEAHKGPGCLRMFPYVPCRGCAPMYRLDPIEVGMAVGPCERSTFAAGRAVKTHDGDLGEEFTWTCDGGPLGGTWNNGATALTGALVCRD